MQESKTNNNKTKRHKISSDVTCRVKGEAKKDEKEKKVAQTRHKTIQDKTNHDRRDIGDTRSQTKTPNQTR